MQKPALPLMPVLPELGGGIKLKRTRGIRSLFDLNTVFSVTSGRAAFYLALRTQGIGKGDEVLVPAYHCPSFIEPVEYVGATPIFFDITKNLEIDVEDIKKKLTDRTKAILVPHFFGIRQNIKRLREQCSLKDNVSIVEDCAHDFFLDYQNIPNDMQGDYVIGSLIKFFPVYEGGVLASKKPFNVELKKQTLMQEFKSLYNLLHMAVRYGRLRWIAPFFNMIDILRTPKSDDIEVPLNLEEAPYEKLENEIEHLDVDLLDKHASKITNYIIKHSDFDAIAIKRRENYQFVLEQLSVEPSIDLSLNKLDSDVIPYMVLVRLSKPMPQHAALKEMGLPIWRWDRLYNSDCKRAYEYACSVIQIPCHQQLRKEELTALVDGVKKCIGGK